MPDIKPVIQLAKERALFRFSALATSMLQDANTSIAEMIPAASQSEQKTISLAREFLQVEGAQFLKRLTTSYGGYMERAMQTMYRDLRQGLHEISADNLTLMDHDTVTRQIEVERRVLRLRDADQQSLGRLNLMIAQLHGEHDVRERENPFRPYLMARALHDVLCSMVSTNNVCTLLFDHMSGAMANRLPEYFAAIRDVFEANGVQVRLLARPSSLSKRDREILSPANQNFPNVIYASAGPSGGSGQAPFPNSVTAPPPHSSLTSPALERVLTLLQQSGMEANSVMRAPQQESQSALQDFVWKMFNQSAPGRIPSNPRYPDGTVNNRPAAGPRALQPEAHPLIGRLGELQRHAMDAGSSETARIFDLHAELGVENDASGNATDVSSMDRVAVDVVAILFNYIVQDELIPLAFRSQIARLQVPFLKASILDPDVLQEIDHPVRKLLNRMASVAIALDEQSDAGRTILTEITQVADHILRDFETEINVFGVALAQLDSVVETALRTFDAQISAAAAALEAAEKDPQDRDVMLVNTVNALRERLSSLETDPRAADFIVKIWSRVLVHVSQHDDIDIKPYLDAIPELIWSVQMTLDAGERNALILLLPKLAVRLREGLALIQMPAAESKQALDELVSMHSQVLRFASADPLHYSARLGSLIQHFSGLQIGASAPDVAAIHAPTVPHDRLQASLAQFDVQAQSYLDSDVGTLLSADAKWLKGMQPGTSVEWWMSDRYVPATLMWVNQQQSFYLFRIDPSALSEGQSGLLIYSSISLIKALREGSVGMIEYAPIFDRAIESLLLTEDEPVAATE